MQQYGSKYFACRPPSPDRGGWGQKVKIQLFQNMVMLHIKLKGMTNAATYKHIYTQHDPWGGVKGQNNFFSESSHVAYQINGNGA